MDEITMADLLAELMQHVGFALWQLQELETTTATYVVLRLRNSRGIGKERARKLLDEAEKRTFGSLLRELRQVGVLPGAIGERLASTLEDRNWLVHRSRRENRGVLSKFEMYTGLVDRLDHIARNALAFNKVLAAEVRVHVLKAGTSEQTLDREADRLAKAWGVRS